MFHSEDLRMEYLIIKKSVCVSVVLGLILCGLHANCTTTLSENATSAPEIQIRTPVQKWLAFDKALKKMSAMLVKNILPQAMRASETLNLTSDCSRGLMKFLIGIKQTKLWAYRMLDSSGKVPIGIFSGSINSLGDYDLCINEKLPGNIPAQYCTVDLAPPLPSRVPFTSFDDIYPEFINITHPESVATEFLRKARSFSQVHIRTSVCVPSTCSKEEVQRIATNLMEKIEIEFDVLIPNCETKAETVIFSTRELVIIGVLSTLLLLAIVATVTDVTLKLLSHEEQYTRSLSIPMKCLLCFSFYTNAVRLLKKDDSPDSIKVFHGMKVITILWVILCHTYICWNHQAMSALLNARAKALTLPTTIISNGFMSVETFFFISAVLVSYGVMKMKETRLNIFLYVFRRVWRLAPPFMLVIACSYLIPYLGSGPVWKETIVDGLTEKCKNYWWTNLLFINNFLPKDDMCLYWTWYVAVDTQLYFVSLIVLIPLKRNPRLGLIMNGVLFVAGTSISAAFHIYYNLPPTVITAYNHPIDADYLTERVYFRTYVHCSSYCVGLAVGYILATKQKIRIPLGINLFGWVAAFTVALSVLYGVYDWNLGNVPGMFVSTLYACTNKLAWSLSLAWVTISCMSGNGGIAESILSWPAFVPLGRLTYMTYLIHPIIQYMYFGSTRTLIRGAHRTLAFLYLADVVLGFICACILSLLFESPFMALEKVLLSSRTTRPDQREKSENQDQKPTQIHCGPEADFGDSKDVYAIHIKAIDSDR